MLRQREPKRLQRRLGILDRAIPAIRIGPGFPLRQGQQAIAFSARQVTPSRRALCNTCGPKFPRP